MKRIYLLLLGLVLLSTACDLDLGGTVPTFKSPTIASFTASQATIAPGESTVLTWQVSGSSPLSLSLQPTIGDVTGRTSLSVTPAETTTYTLVANNDRGSRTAQVTVIIDDGSGEPAKGELKLGKDKHPDYGDYLVNEAGFTLYLFEKDTQGAGESTCFNDCAEHWPALTYNPEETDLGADTGLDSRKLDSFEREDGTYQVTYNGWPLYYYFKDKAAGDTNGHGLGDVWYMVSPDGNKLESGDPKPDPEPDPQPEKDPHTVKLAHSNSYGKYLTNADGYALYVFRKDTPGEKESACYDACAQAWPAYSYDPTTHEPYADEGVNADYLDSFERNDGAYQISYKGYPVYTYSGDSAPQDTNGQGVADAWYLISPKGEPITKAKEPQPKEKVVVKVASSEAYGDYLVNVSGRSLYLFRNDTQGSGKSTCYDACAATWPAFTYTHDYEELAAGDGVNADYLGSIKREDGSYQVTYNGYPLYYYASDKNPGDTNGHGVGEVWYLVTPEGKQAGGP